MNNTKSALPSTTAECDVLIAEKRAQLEAAHAEIRIATALAQRAGADTPRSTAARKSMADIEAQIEALVDLRIGRAHIELVEADAAHVAGIEAARAAAREAQEQVAAAQAPLQELYESCPCQTQEALAREAKRVAEFAQYSVSDRLRNYDKFRAENGDALARAQALIGGQQ